jgi:hypothetical protein
MPNGHVGNDRLVPIKQYTDGVNVYGYASCNPVIRRDYGGLSCEWVTITVGPWFLDHTEKDMINDFSIGWQNMDTTIPIHTFEPSNEPENSVKHNGFGVCRCVYTRERYQEYTCCDGEVKARRLWSKWFGDRMTTPGYILPCGKCSCIYDKVTLGPGDGLDYSNGQQYWTLPAKPWHPSIGN